MAHLQIINEFLDKIQIEKNILILYAVEAGSRAWGIESPDSDYDVRFIFCGTNYDDYLINKVPDTVELFSEDRLYDFSGWDIRKATHLLSKGNGNLMEWLLSPIVYLNRDNWIKGMRELSFDRIGLIRCYSGLSRSMEKYAYLPDGMVNIKKYFYVIRPMVVLSWFLHQDANDMTLPQIFLPSLIEEMVDKKMIENNVAQEICTLIEKKKNLSEKSETETKNPIIEQWIIALRINVLLDGGSKDNVKKLEERQSESNAFILQTLKTYCSWKNDI